LRTGHQQAIRAQEIVFLADDDVLVVGGADVLAPSVVALATIAAGDVHGRVSALSMTVISLRSRLGLVLSRRMRSLTTARSSDGTACRWSRRRAIFQAAGLGLEGVVAAVAVLVDPFAIE